MTDITPKNIKNRLRTNKKVGKSTSGERYRFPSAPKRIKKPKIDPKVRQQGREKRRKKKTRRELINIYLSTIHFNTDSEYSIEYVNSILDHVEILEHRILELTTPWKIDSKCLLNLAGYCRTQVCSWKPVLMGKRLIHLDNMVRRQPFLAHERIEMLILFNEVWGEAAVPDEPMDSNPIRSRDKKWHACALGLLRICPEISSD